MNQFTKAMSYFFVAVSTKENLEICKKYALAGFPSTINGLWAYVDINIEDYVTFLYGARAHNLYRVAKKEAIKNAKELPPWKPLTFASGLTVDFPFRIYLEQVRELNESIAKPEFSFIAENLLLRGGYRKTHFQADQTTLQNVSQMGEISKDKIDALRMPSYQTFVPKFIRRRKSGPFSFQFKEIILQSLIRQYLSKPKNFKNFLRQMNLDKFSNVEFEVLGEKAFPEGHVDILAKETSPKGTMKQIIIEVKLDRATNNDVEQLHRYVNEIGEECIASVLIAKYFSRNIVPLKQHMYFWTYEFTGLQLKEKAYPFDDLLSALNILPYNA